MVKNLPAMQQTGVRFLGQEDPLEKGMTTHHSIFVYRTPWTEEPSRLLSMGSQRVGHDQVTNTHTQIVRTSRTYKLFITWSEWSGDSGKTAKHVSKLSGQILIFYIKIRVASTQIYAFHKSHEKLNMLVLRYIYCAYMLI